MTEEDFLYLTVQEKQQQQQHFHMWHMMINALFVPTKLKVEPYAPCALSVWSKKQ